MAHQCEQRWLKLFSCRLPLSLLLLLSLSLVLQVGEAKRTTGEYSAKLIDWQDEGTHKKRECNDLHEYPVRRCYEGGFGCSID